MDLLDLFSGIGGFSLAGDVAGFRTIGFCEIEPYPCCVLARHWPGVPILEDVKRVGRSTVERLVADGDSSHDLIITAGFPCQDISYAGRGAGLAGERSGLFFEVARLTRELLPRYLLLENVAALLTRGLDAVLGTLASLGYDALWSCVPACAVGAPHRRDRVWIVATPQDGTSEARLRSIYESAMSRLTPFGDIAEGWPTATASDAWACDHNRSQVIPCNGRVLTGKAGLGLGQAARGETWPTPTAGENRTGGVAPMDGGAYSRKMLDGAIGEEARKELMGSLNPSWVETLMGYPIGYTLPEGEPLLHLPGEWPAGLGAPQHEWEPPRLTTVKEHRASRLKALGNSIVPQVALLWMEAIAKTERRRGELA